MVIKFITGFGDFEKVVGHSETNHPSEFLKVAKEVGYIQINEVDYMFIDSIFIPTMKDAYLDGINIIVQIIDYDN